MRKMVAWGMVLIGPLMVTACGATEAKAQGNHPVHLTQHTNQGNPFTGLHAASLLQLSHDLTTVQHNLALMYSQQVVYWNDSLLPQTAALQLQENQAVSTYNQASILVPGDARQVLADINGLALTHQKSVAYLKPVLNQVIAETAKFVKTTLTPWKGQGAPIGMTQAKLTQEFHQEDNIFLHADGVLEKAALQASLEYHHALQ